MGRSRENPASNCTLLSLELVARRDSIATACVDGDGEILALLLAWQSCGPTMCAPDGRIALKMILLSH
jgi:hypothetical protein